uniref:NADH-ubiquinone oxidoreductase chain 1 n=1 Tax=Gynaikothrips uzeli TaxID=1422814 RepID=A0A8A5L6V2_9NEOP|nr:NADH dehydrogenase subunit 1 [Gynaikothrips uzeli]
MIFFIVIFIFILLIFLSVAFFTLLERKVLSYMQYRKGPNKIGFIGIMQPFADGMKLFTKENIMPSTSNSMIFFIMPIMTLITSIMIWIISPYFFTYLFFNMGFIMFFCLSTLTVYSAILSSWASNSNYSMLGSLRVIAQMISYEISMAMIMIPFFLMVNSLSLYEFFNLQNNFFFMLIPLGLMWIVSCFAETNRTPFDFAEGESELVSGFNIEYSSVLFAYIFLAEYCSIIFMSMMTIVLMFKGNFFSFIFYLKIGLMCFLFIWIRGTLPRFRYDKLMFLNWKIFLPTTIMLLMFYSTISMMMKFFMI